MTPVRKAFGRILASAVLGGALVAATTTTAGAADDILSGVDRTLRQTAARILATATPGEPLEVVTTTRTSAGPRIISSIASTPEQALDLIAAGLSRSSTIGVDMAHPVQIDITNDTYRSQQWALTRFGAESLWRTSSGSGVVVAVIDTGVRAWHPDLRRQVRKGYDFVDPGTSAMDANGHGTHVAGIIAALAGNRQGIAGLARSAQILPVRVLDASGSGDTADVARGIVWAADHGANVINLSLGSSWSDSAGKAAVEYAQSKNILVVAAAGNSGCGLLLGSPTSYPAAYAGVVGVGAIDANGSTASYSSCGSWVDVMAPGSRIISTMVETPDSSLGCQPRYCYLSGTSMATPYAAAAAALEIAHLGRGWRASTVRSLMQSTADDIGSRGYDTRTGNGVINPRRMLAAR
ncbi:S8 family peptidase [Aeromicrobium sp.]|uniref:S8 family peptidase n=1 Tax=Aeromicrobium sp. TaxID=1871063 RepID=UPI003C49CED8